MRIKIINIGIISIFLFLFFGVFNLAVIKGKKFKALSDKNCVRLLPQPGSRGRILDRQGSIIVDNRLSYDVLVIAKDLKDAETNLREVSGILGISFTELKDTFRNNYTASFIPALVAKNIDKSKALALEELKLGLADVVIQPHPERRYPYGRLASHLLGHLGEIDRWRLTRLADYGYKTKDIVGFGGIEEKYDYYLRQEDGGMSVEVDHRGRFVRVLGFKPPKDGKDIQLTLNLKIQKIIEESLKNKIGSVIFMDPYSGEIIALASSPAFNPEAFVEKPNPSLPGIFKDPDAPLLNRAISGLYPAASVFKLIVACAAIEAGKINLSTTFSCSGSMHIGKRQFSCWDTHNQQNLLGAITHSCDVFFYRTGLLAGAQLIHDYALKFGLASPTAIDLPYEARGFVPSPLWKRVYRFQNWFDGDTANLAIGQGELLVTPLQIARMMAVFANGANLVTPYLVKAVAGCDISAYQKKIIPLPVKKSTIDNIRQGLKNVVAQSTGTANVLSVLTVPVAGKTGTAQASRGQPHGWFAGFLPFQHPKFVICVFLEHGGSGHMACLLTKQIIEAMIKEDLLMAQ